MSHWCFWVIPALFLLFNKELRGLEMSVQRSSARVFTEMRSIWVYRINVPRHSPHPSSSPLSSSMLPSDPGFGFHAICGSAPHPPVSEQSDCSSTPSPISKNWLLTFLALCSCTVPPPCLIIYIGYLRPASTLNRVPRFKAKCSTFTSLSIWLTAAWSMDISTRLPELV